MTRDSLKADGWAALLSAVLVLPQGIAFATLAGLPPQYGLYSAVIPCMVAALAGSSHHVVTGPTNANSLALAAMLTPLAAVASPQYIELALAVTLLVGVFQWLTGALRLGAIANFISPSALLGFMTGAALLIALHALPDGLGLSDSGRSLADLMQAFWQGTAVISAPALFIALMTIAIAFTLRRWRPALPHMLVALVLASAGAWWWSRTHLPVAGPTAPLHDPWALRLLGPLPSAWPPFHPPHIEWKQWPGLLGMAAALTVVALAQSIAIAKAVAVKSGQHIDGNREFVGQGLANIAGSFFSAYVSCGSLNRSMPNFEAGARTPLAAVMAGLLVVPLVALSGPLLRWVPYAAIAGLLCMVAWQLIELDRWRQLWKGSRSEFLVALVTLVATLFARIEIAILIGSAMSLGFYLQRTAKPAMRTMIIDTQAHARNFAVAQPSDEGVKECPQFKLLRMEGSVYYGATTHVTDVLQAARQSGQKHLLVMAKSMNFVDVAGSTLWRQELQQRRAVGGDLYFHRPREPVIEQWQRDGFLAALGPDHLFASKHEAIRSIVPKLDGGMCAQCTVRCFQECPPRS